MTRPPITLYSQLRAVVRLFNSTISLECRKYKSKKYPNGPSMTWVKDVLEQGREKDPEIYDHFVGLIREAGWTPMKATKVPA